MRKNRLLLLLAPIAIAACVPAVSMAQSADYYRSPMDIPIFFSSNFAEIRTDRFHTGIDIKTQGVVGLPLRAVADGYIMRVTVAPGGYGRALYIAHPNGTMSVYGHLDRFTPQVEKYLKAERYRLKKSDIDLFPDAIRFPVKKGDLIGYAGNSGRSTGPHLHYEVRKSANSFAMNVIARGWATAKDDIPPRLIKLYRVDVDTLRGVPLHSEPVGYELRRLSDGNYSLSVPQPVRVGRTSYFAIETTDRKNDVANTFGIFRVRMSVDGSERVVFEKDGILFPDTRKAALSTIYELQRNSRNEIIMLAQRGTNALPMYKKTVDRGALRLGPSGVLAGAESSLVEIVVEDDAQNAVTLTFTAAYDPAVVSPASPASPAETAANVTAEPQTPSGTPMERVATGRTDFLNYADGLAVNIPRGALCEPVFYSQSVVEQDVEIRDDGIKPLSRLYRLNGGSLPLQKAMNIAVKAEMPENLQPQACLAMVSAAGKLSFAGGRYSKGAVSGSVSGFGTYCVAFDATPPRVRASFEEGADLTAEKSVTISAADNFSGLSTFSGTIDGQWIIFERNVGRGEYVHIFDMDRLALGRKHNLVFTIRDRMGNSTTFRRTFFK